jgi:hypothetical protein
MKLRELRFAPQELVSVHSWSLQPYPSGKTKNSVGSNDSETRQPQCDSNATILSPP